MTHELLELENRILRDEEFIHSQSEDKFSDLEDLSEFRSIGDVIKQMSFNSIPNQQPIQKENYLWLNVFILGALSTKKTCAKALVVVGMWTNANSTYLQN